MFTITIENTTTGTTEIIAKDIREIIGILESVNWGTTTRVIMEVKR